MAVDSTIGARGYFEVVEVLRDELLRNNKVRTVTVGNISEVDLDKQTIFPLAHIIVKNLVVLDVCVSCFQIIGLPSTVALPEATPIVHAGKTPTPAKVTNITASKEMICL